MFISVNIDPVKTSELLLSQVDFAPDDVISGLFEGVYCHRMMRPLLSSTS